MRAFALVPRDAQNANLVVSGTLHICGHSAYVLTDLGSLHSLTSTQFAIKLIGPLNAVDYELYVSQSMNSNIARSIVHKFYDILIGSAHLLGDLISLNMGHFDVILGMNRLFTNFATKDFIAEWVMIEIPDEVEVTFEGKGVVS